VGEALSGSIARFSTKETKILSTAMKTPAVCNTKAMVSEDCCSKFIKKMKKTEVYSSWEAWWLSMGGVVAQW
jgi:hypothetical protein